MHTCAVLADATVAGWGANVQMQLGYVSSDMCTTGPSPYPCSETPQRVPGVTNVRQIATGSAHTCVVHVNGDVECWGSASSGALGDGTSASTNRGPNGVAILHGAAEVAAGEGSACARMNDGTVQCWGANGYGQLGVMPTATACGNACIDTPNAIPGLTGVVQIAMNIAVACARMSDGTVQCWGDDVSGQAGQPSTATCGTEPCVVPPAAVPGVAGATFIAVADDVAFAVLADGSVLGWGDNHTGRLGNGTTTPVTMPVRPAF
jgi:alpha-tubulin suppressor-like RCC1 family protein